MPDTIEAAVLEERERALKHIDALRRLALNEEPMRDDGVLQYLTLAYQRIASGQ